MNITSGILLNSRDFVHRFFNSKFNEDVDPIKLSSYSEIQPFLEYIGFNLSDESKSPYLNYSKKQLGRAFLKLYLYKKEPRFIKKSYLGREYFINAAGEDILSCIEQTDLLNNDDESISWWTELFSKARMIDQDIKVDIGIKGEELSINYEKDRVGMIPDLVSIDDSTAGYDLLSWEFSSLNSRLMIEVKTSKKNIDSAEAFITKNEYIKANENDNYVFHFWLIEENSTKLAVLKNDLVLSEAPTEDNHGVWTDYKINFSIFKNYFKTIS